MSNLKKIREKKGLTQTELAEAIGTDKYMISKFENGICLPIPKMTTKICLTLNSEVGKIWKKSEIYIIPRNLASERRNALNRLTYYNFACRLPKACCNALQQDKLRQMGYSSRKEWLLKQIERFNQEFETFEKKRRK